MSNLVAERNGISGQGTERRIAPTQIAHFVVYTSRFPEMVAFYRTLFDLRSSHEDANVAFMTYDEEHHRIAVVNVPNLADRPEGTVGFHHVAFTYATLKDLLETHARLDALGVKPYWTVNHGPTTSMYFRDPDGNRVEMQVDNFDTAEEGIAYCRLPEFAENPIGVDIDPADMLQRLRNGETEQALKRRPNIGPRGMDDFPR
jgi:catechol-2,3-dioxygenase